MFTVALVGPDALGTRVARALVQRLPVPAVHLRDGPRPDSSNRLPPAGWLLRWLPDARSAGSPGRRALRRLVGWWYRRAGFIVILHGSAEVEGWWSGSWRTHSDGLTASAIPAQLVVVLQGASARAPEGRRQRRARRPEPAARRSPSGSSASLLVVDAGQPIDRLLDEIEGCLRSRAARPRLPLGAHVAPFPGPGGVG